MLRKLALLGGWFGAAFAVHTAFAMVSLGPSRNWLALAVYALGLAAMFPLHRTTRGPLALAVAFGLCFALFVQGLFFAFAEPDASRAVAVLLAVPLAALVIRRWPVENEDAWFSLHARPVMALALAFALPPFAVGVIGAKQADPTPYERARRALGYHPLEALAFEGMGLDRQAHAASGWVAFRSGASVTPEIRSEVEGACGELAANDPARGVRCAYDRLASKSDAIRKRQNAFNVSALASAVPWAILLLFAWRGRRGRPGVHARDGVSDA